jgi:hypothetical protein
MAAPSTPTPTVVEAAVKRLLRPLVRLMLRHGLPHAALAELAKRVYVEVAMDDFALEGKKSTISRASVLTGLTRKDVQRLVEEAGTGPAEPAAHYNRAARVLTAWVRDPDFRDAKGAAKPLPAEGRISFATLVKRHSGDMPARAVLDELVRVGAVERLGDGRLAPVARAYVPQRGSTEKIDILGHDTADLIDTIDHNIEHGADDARFQRKVMYHALPARAVPAFRKLSATQAQALLEKLDRWLAEHDTDPAIGEATARVGLGIYYFEERQAPASASARKPS